MAVGAYRARVLLNTNDTQHGVLGRPLVEVEVESGGALMSVSRDSIEYGVVGVGVDTTAGVVIENMGGDTLEVSEIRVTNGVFEVDTSWIELAPLGRYELGVTFRPVGVEEYSGYVELLSNGWNADTVWIYLHGYGDEVTGIVEGSGIPEAYGLGQNYPNPFNGVTRISYQLPEGGEVRLEIYDVLGQRVRVVLDGWQEAGYHGVEWDGRDAEGTQVSSGLYIYRFEAGPYRKVQKMMLLK